MANVGYLVPVGALFQAFSDQGIVGSGFKINTYVGGTVSTPLTTYTDATLGTPNSNPIVLGSNGRFAGIINIWVPAGTLTKLVLTDANNNTLVGGTIDNVVAVGDSSALSGGQIGSALWPQTVAEVAASVTPSNYQFPPLNPYRYGADGLNGANDSTAYTRVNSVLAQITGTVGFSEEYFAPGYPRTADEITAAVLPNEYQFWPDDGNYLNLWRFLTAPQIAQVRAGGTALDLSANIQIAINFIEGKAPGAIATFGTLVGGSGYVNGTYTFVPLTGGHGLYAHANITVAGGAVTAVTMAALTPNSYQGNPGNGYQVSDTLSANNANLGGSGSGFSIAVATLATGGSQIAGGTLYVPKGNYYCGSTTIRLGGHVRMMGASYQACQFSWNSGFSGHCFELGPDLSGFFGFSGFYQMGAVLDNITINMPNGATCGIYTQSSQQQSSIQHVTINNVCTTAIDIEDLDGSTTFTIEDVQINGSLTAMGATGIGIISNMHNVVNITRVAIEGSGTGTNNGQFLQGVAIQSGGHVIRDLHCELVTTAVDILGTTGEYPQVITRLTHTNTSLSTPKSVWVHSGFVGHTVLEGCTAATGIIIYQNDVTGAKLGGGSTIILPFLSTSGTAGDISYLENAIVSGVEVAFNASAGTFTPDVGQADWLLMNITAATTTIAAPVYSGNAMPAILKGREITLTLYNNGAGGLSAVNFNAVFHQAAPSLPGNNQNTSSKFRWTGSLWYQVTPWTTAFSN